MEAPNLKVIDIIQQASEKEVYSNEPIARVNDHVVRMSVMTGPYFWHLHPDSDETFLVIEGIVIIELEDQTVELGPNQAFTIPQNVRHRTRPKGSRSVNLTFERAGMTTLKVSEKD